MSHENSPPYLAYTVRSDGERQVWCKIGAAWPHGVGKDGFNIELESQPFPDPKTGRVKIVLRGQRFYKPQDTTRTAPDAASVVHTTRHSGGGFYCSSCDGRGVVLHPARGPVPCAFCRGSKGGG